MKTKLDPAEKARRQLWRLRAFAQPSQYERHHFTRAERNAIKAEEEKANPTKPTMTAAQFYRMFLAMTALSLPQNKYTAEKANV